MTLQHNSPSGNADQIISPFNGEELRYNHLWKQRRSSQDSIYCVADPGGVVLCRCSGCILTDDHMALEEILQDVIDRMGWREKKWVLLYDCSRLKGMEIAARGKLIELLSAQPQLTGVLFNAPSYLIKSLVRLAVTFYTPGFKIAITDNIRESYSMAARWLGHRIEVPDAPLLDEKPPAADPAINKDIAAILQILGDVEWNKPGIGLLENNVHGETWKPFQNMMALLKSDLDIMISKREERRAELERNNKHELFLQHKMSQALEESRAARIVFKQESRRNMLLTREVVETQKEILFSLGEIIESRSRETANHIRRVAEYSTLLSRLCGMSDKEQQHILHASPMHDAGKIAIPDAILNKPGKLTDDEFSIMQDHARIGWEMLRGSPLEIMNVAAIIAHQHHEKWNGRGYPNRLKGTDIHISGRIVALADVFDALGSDRCYKKAWPLEKIIDLLQNERGEQFDPDIIDLFIDNLDAFLVIRKRFPDATA